MQKRYEQLYAGKFENVVGMDKFLGKYILPKLAEEIENYKWFYTLWHGCVVVYLLFCALIFFHITVLYIIYNKFLSFVTFNIYKRSLCYIISNKGHLDSFLVFILDWPKSSFGFFIASYKNLNELSGQPNSCTEHCHENHSTNHVFLLVISLGVYSLQWDY